MSQRKINRERDRHQKFVTELTIKFLKFKSHTDDAAEIIKRYNWYNALWLKRVTAHNRRNSAEYLLRPTAFEEGVKHLDKQGAE